MFENRLELKRDGVLIATHWNGEAKQHETTNVTHLAPALLFERTTLAPEVTLRDIFMLIEQHKKQLCMMLGNWCEEFVEEGLHGSGKGLKSVMELRLGWKLNTYDGKSLYGYHFPEFYGVDKEGQQYAIEQCSAADLASLPLRLEKRIECYNRTDAKEGPTEYEDPTYSLGHILYGIIWELSFFGPPKERDRKAKELDARIQAIKDGTAKLVSWDEVKKGLEKDG